MRTYAIIIGCSKSGTTSLYRYLGQHPDIAPCVEKEPNFFASDENWERGFEWYRDLWEEAGKVFLEGTTLYTWYPLLPNAAKRMKSVEKKGDFRFIYIMRDPIPRAESHIMQSAWHGHVSQREPVQNPWLMEVSRYAKQLDEYERRFGRERMFLTTLEKLRDKPAHTLESLCRFLDIPEYSFEVGEKHNQTVEKTVPGRIWNRLREIDWLRRVVRVVPRTYRGVVRDWMSPTVEEAKEQYQLTREQRVRFLEALSDDLRRLERFYGVDTSQWDLSP